MPTEPGLKAMRTFYRCASEVDGTSTEGTVVAYYCRCQAMQKVIAVGMGGMSPADKGQLMQLMDALEANKAEVKALGVIEAKSGAACVAKFARTVFDVADLEDKSGTASKDTVRRRSRRFPPSLVLSRLSPSK